MTNKQLIILVRKYLKGKANLEERTFIEAWYQEAHTGSDIESILSVTELRELENLIFANIQSRISVPDGLKRRKTARLAYLRPVAAAACVAGIAVASWLAYFHFSDRPAYTELYSKPGQVQKIILSDGSLVWLNADSRLRFPKTFGRKGAREIFLEGEAYFEVAKDQEHPFLVHARDVTTRVLGTKFDVKAYHGNTGVEVTLLEGKVMLTAPAANRAAKKQDTLFLAPDEKAFFPGTQPVTNHAIAQQMTVGHDSGHGSDLTSIQASRSSLLKKNIVDAQGAAAWRNGELVFNQEPLQSVVESLSRKYDIRIKVDTLLQHEPVTARLSGLSAEDALLQVTRQLKRKSGNGNVMSEEKVQFKKEGNVYSIE